MSMNRITSLLVALAAFFALTSSGFAQRWQPFIEPDAFNPDYEFFALAEYDDFGGNPEPKTGWYGSVVRTTVFVTRPDREQSNQKGDWTWGNRYDIGYMTEADHGWHFSHWHVDGPNVNNKLRVERINRYNPDDDPIDADDDDGFIPVNPPTDRNVTIFLGGEARVYDLNDSINECKLSNWEANKTFRLDQYHHGSVLEPFFGVRYMTFVDFDLHDSYARFDTTGLPVPAAPVTQDTGVIEQIIRNTNSFENHMITGQVGFRWSQQMHNRWNLSSELRVFAGGNFQTLQNYTNTTITEYDGVGEGAGTDAIRVTETRSAGHQQEFVFGVDVRAEAAYAVTRDVSLLFGMEFLGFPGGIGRGPNLLLNDEDIYMVAGTFGVVINR